MTVTRNLLIQPLRGMDERWRPPLVAAKLVQDMTWDERDGWRNAGGFRDIYPKDNEGASRFVGFGAVKSLHWFSQHGGARDWLIAEALGQWRILTPWTRPPAWRVMTGPDGQALVDHTIPSVPTFPAQSAVYGDRLYIVNGIDSPLVFDGIKAEPPGFDGPPPQPDGIAGATVTVDIAGLGVGTAGKAFGYRYRYSRLNERGQESPLSPPSDRIEGTNAATVRTGIGLSIDRGPGHCVGGRLYRTHDLYGSTGDLLIDGEAEVYYFVQEFQDNAGTLVQDFVHDSHLATAVNPDLLGPWPSGAYLIASFQDSLWLASSARLYFSSPGRPEEFPLDNTLSLGNGDLGSPTALYPTRTALVLHRERGISFIKGNHTDGFREIVYDGKIGAIGPNALDVIPNQGLAFLAHGGIYLLVGTLDNDGTPTSLTRLSPSIPDIMERVNWTAAKQACIKAYHRANELWIALPLDGAVNNSHVLVYHYDVGSWSLRPDFPIADMIIKGDHTGDLYFGSSDATTHPGVHVYTSGYLTKNGTTIVPRYETTDVDFTTVYEQVGLAHVQVYCVGHGDNDIQLEIYRNHDYAASVVENFTTTVKATNQQAADDDWPVYGEGTWADATWKKLRPVSVRFDLDIHNQGPVRELRLGLSAVGANIHIIGLEIGVTEGPHRNQRPLNLAVTGEAR